MLCKGIHTVDGCAAKTPLGEQPCGWPIDYKASSVEALQPDPSVQAEHAVQRDSYSRRLRGQNAAWRTALWVAELSVKGRASARVLAEGGGDSDGGERRPLLQGDSDEDEAACGEGSSVGGSGLRRRRRSPSPKRWWPSYPRVQQGPPTEEHEMLLAPDPGPSTSASGPGGIADQGNEPVPAGRRAPHETNLRLGDKASPHYRDIDGSYSFPHLERRHPRLGESLDGLEDTLRDLYLLHGGPHKGEFEIQCPFNNPSGGIKIHIRIEELNFSNGTIFEVFVDLFRAFWTGLDGRHFGRDGVCLLEEMLVNVLDEAEQTGSGRFTETVKQMIHSRRGNNSVLFRVAKARRLAFQGQRSARGLRANADDEGIEEYIRLARQRNPFVLLIAETPTIGRIIGWTSGMELFLKFLLISSALFGPVWMVVMSVKQPIARTAATRVPGERMFAPPCCITLHCYNSLACAQFGRDGVCLLEEMLVNVLDEAEQTGSGRFTETVKQMIHSRRGNNSVLFRVAKANRFAFQGQRYARGLRYAGGRFWLGQMPMMKPTVPFVLLRCLRCYDIIDDDSGDFVL
ncbi:uncharacterized protein EMH_0056280 [Eimeria mitis]|uniref:Uncharacterized protein n=1 Tax=Eimeria mitis TaxID=44415 RepID=U6JXS4_9EIME|nr:uncharacterized protein EMH_0056280 [Eimeria mitis]CDJ30229.1 hypothetical protein, conserved [Eimeria mitis]